MLAGIILSCAEIAPASQYLTHSSWSVDAQLANSETWIRKSKSCRRLRVSWRGARRAASRLTVIAGVAFQRMRWNSALRKVSRSGPLHHPSDGPPPLEIG